MESSMAAAENECESPNNGYVIGTCTCVKRKRERERQARKAAFV